MTPHPRIIKSAEEPFNYRIYNNGAASMRNSMHDERIETVPPREYCLISKSDSRNTKVVIATQDNPTQPCGQAILMGFTDSRESYKMYRIRIHVDYARTKRTLPDLFVLDDTTFVPYEQWQQSENGQAHVPQYRRNGGM